MELTFQKKKLLTETQSSKPADGAGKGSQGLIFSMMMETQSVLSEAEDQSQSHCLK